MASLALKHCVATSSPSSFSTLRSIKAPLPLLSRSCCPSHIFLHRQSSAKRLFSTTPSPMASKSQQFFDFVKNRRSIYPLKKESTISNAQIQEIINQAILHVPSSFNSQSTRVILLLGKEHDKLWDITKDVLKGIVPAENYGATEQKLNMFQGAYGTILFFEHRSTVSDFQQKFATYADKFPIWATQSDAMHQFSIWTALEAEGLGANLQHYNPLIDEKVAQEWNVPKDWELNAQLVFGTPGAPAGEKTFKEVEGERFKVFGA